MVLSSLLSNCVHNVPLLGNLLHLGGGISIFLNTPLWNGLHSITVHSWLFFHLNGLLQTLPWRVSLLCWSPLCWRGAVVSGTFSGWSILSARSVRVCVQFIFLNWLCPIIPIPHPARLSANSQGISSGVRLTWEFILNCSRVINTHRTFYKWVETRISFIDV